MTPDRMDASYQFPRRMAGCSRMPFSMEEFDWPSHRFGTRTLRTTTRGTPVMIRASRSN